MSIENGMTIPDVRSSPQGCAILTNRNHDEDDDDDDDDDDDSMVMIQKLWLLFEELGEKMAKV